MNRKTLNIAIGIAAVAVIAIAAVAVSHVHRFAYTETTGFYFEGLNSTQIGSVAASAYDNKNRPVRNLYCFEQYRSGDDYIFMPWRFDMVFYTGFQRIELLVPDSLVDRITAVYFKTGEIITRYSFDDFRKQWPHQCADGLCRFSSPETIAPPFRFVAAVQYVRHTSDITATTLRRCMYALVTLLCLLIALRFRVEFARLFSTMYCKGKALFVRYRKIFKPLLAFLLGTLFAFVLLEVSLRIIGYIHNQSHYNKQIDAATVSGNTIICAGDSFTESFGATEGNDYPAQLQKLLNHCDSNDLSVYNFGRSGKNTAQIALEIPLYIEKHKPRIIVLLAGGANYWNMWGYKKENFFERLRTVKFFKLIIGNLRKEKDKNTFNNDEYLQRRMHYAATLNIENQKHSPFIAILRENNIDSLPMQLQRYCENHSLSENETVALVFYAILRNKHSLVQPFISGEKAHSRRESFFIDLFMLLSQGKNFEIETYDAYYKANWYYLQGYIGDSFSEELLMKSLSQNPYNEDVYHQLFMMEKKIGLPDDYRENRFSLADTVSYYKALLALSNTEASFNHSNIIEVFDRSTPTANIDRWVEADLLKVIDLCARSGVQLVLMNYPMRSHAGISYTSNAVLRNIAKQHNIPFVDNEMLFDTITQNRNSYFISDGHCSDKGYHLMAMNLLYVLQQHKLIDSKPDND